MARRVIFCLLLICLYKVCWCTSESGTNNIPALVFASYNQSCNSSFLCNPNSLLSCLSEICQCESPSSQVFLESENVCLSTVGGQCSMESGSTTESFSPKRRCIRNAKCVDVIIDEEVRFSECQCETNFIENSYGECVPGIGQPCNYGNPKECNPAAMVVCKNNRCQCFDELQIYDEETKRCVNPAGTHCIYNSHHFGCVKNAICYPFWKWVPPKCVCKPFYVQTPDRRCVAEILVQQIDNPHHHPHSDHLHHH